MKLYVGCSLTHAPESFRSDVAALKDSLRADYEILDFIGLESGTARDVYEWDINRCVAECDALLAICDHPSIGLGYEMATAIEKLGKPTLGVAAHEALVGRIVIGITQPNFSFARYDRMSDIPSILKAFLVTRL